MKSCSLHKVKNRKKFQADKRNTFLSFLTEKCNDKELLSFTAKQADPAAGKEFGKGKLLSASGNESLPLIHRAR